MSAALVSGLSALETAAMTMGTPKPMHSVRFRRCSFKSFLPPSRKGGIDGLRAAVIAQYVDREFVNFFIRGMVLAQLKPMPQPFSV